MLRQANKRKSKSAHHKNSRWDKFRALQPQFNVSRIRGFVNTRKVLVALTILGSAIVGISLVLDSETKKEEQKVLPNDLEFTDLGEIGTFSVAEPEEPEGQDLTSQEELSGPAFFGPTEQQAHANELNLESPFFPSNVESIPDTLEEALPLRTAQFEETPKASQEAAWLTGKIEEVAD